MHQHPFVNIATEAAVAAGKIIIRHFDRRDLSKIEENSSNNFVSEADLTAAEIIMRTIKAAYPQHGILTRTCAQQHPESDYQWIIDPLSGSHNFMHGLPHFGISIALSVKGKVEHGVVFDPLRQEIFSATRGRGAYLNHKRIRVSTQRQLTHAMIATYSPHDHDQHQSHAYLQALGACLPVCANIRYSGSTALDLAYVAAGRLDGYWAQGLQPWDLAAGTVLIFEAGGLLGDFTGGEKHMDTGNIVTTTPKILKGLLQTLVPVLPKAWL